MKKLFINILALLFVFAACVKEEPTTVSFRSAEYHINVGDTLDLAGELMLTNCEKSPVLTASVDSIINLRADKKVIAIAEGETVITASVGEIEATCTIFISDISLENVVLTAPESIVAGETGVTVTAEVEPQGYNPDNLVWSFKAVPETLEVEYERVKSSEYIVKVRNYVEGAKVTVIVSGKKETAVADTVVMDVVKDVVKATRISLDMPKQLTGGVEGLWASVKATVEPEDYEMENLVWTFTQTEGLEFQSENMGGGEYRISFSNYVHEGKLKIEVKDAHSAAFNSGEIKVLERPVDGVSTLVFKSEKMDLYIGDEPWTPELICEPAGYDPYLLNWTISDESVASLEDGLVTPLKDGNTVLKVTDIISGKEASCEINVVTPVDDAEIASISLSETDLHMKLDEHVVQLVAKCMDASGNRVMNYTALEWSAAPVYDAFEQPVTIVEVSDRGVVTPKNVGTTQITVKDKKRASAWAMCHVTVTAGEIKVEEVRLSHSSAVVAVGKTLALEASVLPRNADDRTIRFTSSDESVASVSEEGLVTGVNVGETDIHAIASNGVKATCHVRVELRAISFDITGMVMGRGAEKELILSKIPEEGFKGEVEWTSSDPDVASVKDGVVTAVSAGDATITASLDGFTADCKVKVAGEDFKFDIHLECSDLSVAEKGLQQDQKVRYIPEYRHNESGMVYIPANVSWSSSDRTIAVVDEEGNVTAVKEDIDSYGFLSENKVVITIEVDGVEKSVDVFVVKAQPREILIKTMPSVDGVEGRMMHGESFVFETEVLPAKAIQEVAFYMTDPDGRYQTCGNTFVAAKVGTYSFTAYVVTGSGTGDSSIETVQKHFSIEVLPIRITDMKMTSETLEMTTGAQAILDVNITPSNASYRNVVWSSSNEAVASVTGAGVVNALAAGEAVITATQPDNNISCTCVVKVEDPVVEINIGDYYYSDGTISSDLDPSKTVIGIVFAKVNASLSDTQMINDHPGCTNGLVVGLDEYNSPFAADRSWGRGDLVDWMNNNGYTQVEDTEKYCGYSNTKGFMAINEANVSSYGDIIRIDLCNVVSQYRNSVEVPESTSGWYAPSFAELKLLYESLDAVNQSMESAEGTVVASTYVTDYTRPGDGKYFEYTRNKVYWPANMNYSYFYGFNMADASSTSNPPLYENGSYDAAVTGESAPLPVRLIFAF